MQPQGSLTEHNLRTLLEEAQNERATGILTVRNGDGTAYTLYFLFGHLFHALGQDRTGDEAVRGALGIGSGDFAFDHKAKLPVDETVKLSIPELIASSGSAPEPQAPPAQPEAQWEPAPEPVQAEAGQEPAAPEPTVPEPEPVAEADAIDQPHPDPEPVAPPEPEPVAPVEAEAPAPRRGVKHRPQPKHGREPIPVPAGQLIYDSLKTSFVDFPRLITTLERESYTGYVRLLTEDAAGLILFKDGRALQCAYDIGDDPDFGLGRQALNDFNAAVTHGQGVLDVVGLSSELVDGLYELMVAKPLYTDLYASWVDTNKLLAFLETKRLSGSVMVRAPGGTGVIILTEGKLTGAYTSESREISESADGVLSICSDPEAMIEVKAAVSDAPRETLDVEGVVGAPPASPAPAPPSTVRGPEPAPTATQTAPALPTFPQPPSPEPSTQQGPSWMPAEPPTVTQSIPSLPTPPPPTVNPTASSLPAFAAAPAAQPFPPPPVAPVDNTDWEGVIADLQATTEEALGNRSRKVKDVLGGADRSRAGVEGAIDQIPTISILFVDSSRLEALAADLRAKLQSHLA